MKKTKKPKFLRNLITFIVTLSLIVGGSNLYNATQPKTVYAVGDLNVEWGVPDGDPIFVVANMLPGDTESRSVDVHNLGPTARDVGIIGEKTEELLNFSTILDFVISENSSDIYGGTTGAKTLAQFFIDSAGPAGLFLSTLGAGDSTTYTFKVTFPPESGNEFQNAKVVFDLIIGLAFDVPEGCEGIDLEGTPIIGTSQAETIDGTEGNDLIQALEGADVINGNGGDDCIFGGPGAENTISGGEGNDVIFGEAGGDHIVGENGNDTIFGGQGADTIEGNNGEDQLFGGTEADLIYGGDDNDTISGGDGADSMFGENGDDQLTGNAGIDDADGGPDTDTCDAEAESNCEL